MNPLKQSIPSCLLLASVLGLQAGEMSVPVAASPTPLPPSPVEKEWRWTSTSYAWLTDISGDITVRDYQFPIDVGMDDVLKDLDFSYMSYSEISYKRWSLGLDVVYAKLSNDRTFAVGPLSGDAGFELEQALITGRLQYTAVNNGALKLDLFTGCRWNYYDVDLHVDTGRRDIHRTGNEDWFDVIVGARAVIQLGGNWFLQSMGDIGGFGAESDLTWQASAGMGYHFTPCISGVLGYRAMGVDYNKGGFLMDTVSHGPALGLSFSF
ncbi:MAG: hypothetical protein JWM59_2026 [Verrucomicrobiales bacterium]|nr:hypothetical protein [Verrucomicrobiales bacterium]